MDSHLLLRDRLHDGAEGRDGGYPHRADGSETAAGQPGVRGRAGRAPVLGGSSSLCVHLSAVTRYCDLI